MCCLTEGSDGRGRRFRSASRRGARPGPVGNERIGGRKKKKKKRVTQLIRNLFAGFALSCIVVQACAFDLVFVF